MLTRREFLVLSGATALVGCDMARSYQIDEGVAREEGAVGRLVGRKMMARSEVLRPQQHKTILQWQVDDADASEMSITLGVGRDLVVPSSPGASSSTLLPNAFASYLAGGMRANPQFLVDYGIDGIGNQLIVDAYPEQVITVPASFIRVTALFDVAAVAGAPVSFYAIVSNGISKGPGLVRSSYASRLLPNGLAEIPVQPFATKMRLWRARTDAMLLMGSVRVTFTGILAGVDSLIESLNFAAGVDAGLIDIPGGCTGIIIANTEGLIATNFVLTQYLDP